MNRDDRKEVKNIVVRFDTTVEKIVVDWVEIKVKIAAPTINLMTFSSFVPTEPSNFTHLFVINQPVKIPRYRPIFGNEYKTIFCGSTSRFPPI